MTLLNRQTNAIFNGGDITPVTWLPFLCNPQDVF